MLVPTHVQFFLATSLRLSKFHTQNSIGNEVYARRTQPGRVNLLVLFCDIVCESEKRYLKEQMPKFICGYGVHLHASKWGFTLAIKGNAKFDTNNTHTPVLVNGSELMVFCFERHNHCVKVRLFVFAVDMYIDHIIFDYRYGALPAQPKYPFE